MKEIVTIQVGSYANFIGSHFWNFQDELLGLADRADSDEIFRNHGLSMDVIYRSGETHQGVLTYTPRLVSVDFRGSLGSMSARGTLYNKAPTTSVDTLTWTGSIETHTSEPLKKNLFLQSLSLEENEDLGTSGGSKIGDSSGVIQDRDIVDSLENEVNYWTDFSKIHYHPQSLYELNGLWVDVEGFNNYGIGRDSFSGTHGEEINERLRFFVEECDLIQGIQFILDDSGGFSGVAGEFLENIADEYPNIPLLLYSARSPSTYTVSKSLKQTIFSNLHDAVSFSRLSSLSKLIVPVGLSSLSASRMSRYLHVNDQKPYHTSAVYASAIHSISLPFRMEPVGPTAQSSYTCGAVNVKELLQMLGGQARQNIVSVLDVAMPAPAYGGHQHQLKNFQPLTPETAEDVEDTHAVETLAVHGVFGAGNKRASVYEVQEAVQVAYENAVGRPRFSHLSVARCPLPIPLPFPSVFGNLVGQHGELLQTTHVLGGGSRTRGSLEVHSIPMAARMRSSNAVLPFLQNRLENLRKFGMARGALGGELLRSWGYGIEEVEEMGEILSDLVKKLNPEFGLSSDSD